MKLLSICIPTYKRPDTLQRCIESICVQIEKYDLGEVVSIYVANDSSPDNTIDVVTNFEDRAYFSYVSREENLGMNQNIKSMLKEAAEFSDYQLIISDDDHLQTDILNEITEFLVEHKSERYEVPLIWTPRYSYTEDGNLHGIVCRPFKFSRSVDASAFNAGRYMFNGFVLSGLILQARFIDFEFWDTYSENAYFPILFCGDLIDRKGAYYWEKNIVHHTVLNDCHWERWGKNDAVIDFRKLSDCVNAYSLMGSHVNGRGESTKFYFSSFPSIYRLIKGSLVSGRFNRNRAETFEAVDELKTKGFMKFELPVRFQIFCSILLSAGISLLKLLVTRVTLIFTPRNDRRDLYHKRIKGNLDVLSSVSVLARSVFP